jgi:gamma-glutamylcyclotransferase (GGCT)/AIG2-like uncharacterized protein YtfP
MVKIFAVGTLKRGFPLHDEGLSDGTYLGEYRTRERFPMIIAGPWYAPMVLDQPGTGLQIKGELYEIPEVSLSRLDALESVGQPQHCAPRSIRSARVIPAARSSTSSRESWRCRSTAGTWRTIRIAASFRPICGRPPHRDQRKRRRCKFVADVAR